MNITEFYRSAKQLKSDVEGGRIDPTTLSDEGRLVLDIAANKISVNDLSNEGRVALGLEPLPEQPGTIQRLREGSINTQANIAKALGLDVFADRTREMWQGIPHMMAEVPGQISRAGQSFRQAAELTGRGELGHAAAELGGGAAETFNAAMGIGAPLIAPVIPSAVATGMATEKLADVAGIPQEMKLGAATITPRMVGEFAGMALPGAAGLAAGRMPKTKMPPIPETTPTVQSISRQMMQEQINISQEMKGATGQRKADLNARASALRRARDEIRRGNYESKKSLLDLLYDRESQEALNAEWRTRYVDPYPAGQQVDPMGGVAPRVSDIAAAERARIVALAQEVGVDPNLYVGAPGEAFELAPGTIVRAGKGRPKKGQRPPTSIEEATPPLTSSVEIGVLDQLRGRSLEKPPQPKRWNVGRMRHELQGEFPAFRELTEEQLTGVARAAEGEISRYDLGPELMERAVDTAASTHPPEMMDFPLFPEVFSEPAVKGKTKPPSKQPSEKPASRGQRINRVANLLQQANKGMVRNTAVRAAKKVVETADRARAEEQATLPPPPRRKGVELKVEESKPMEQVVEETVAEIDKAKTDQQIRELETKPPVADLLKPPAEPTPEVPSVVPAAAAPPVETGSPAAAATLPTARRRGRPAGSTETSMRAKTLKQLLDMEFTRQEAELMYAAARKDSKMMEAFYGMLDDWRSKGLKKHDIAERSGGSKGIETAIERLEAEPLRDAMDDAAVASAARRTVDTALSEMADRASFAEKNAPIEESGLWRPESAGKATPARGHEVRRAEPAIDADLKLTYKAANDLLERFDRKLVISVEADPVRGAQPETVFILRKRDGTPIKGEAEAAGRELTFKNPFDAIKYVELEGPGAMTPHHVAEALLDPTARDSINLANPRFGRDLGIVNANIRVNTPGFVARWNPVFSQLFTYGVDTKMRIHKAVSAMRRRARQVADILDDKELNDLFLLGERRNMTKFQWDEFYATVSDRTKKLWDGEFRGLMNHARDFARRADPTVKYRKDYIPHFPTDIAIETLFDELLRAQDLNKRFPNDPRYKAQADILKDHLRQMKAHRDSVFQRRYRKTPEGGWFGPLDEARALNLDFGKNFLEVMERYFDGLERKALIDRLAPAVKRAVNSEGLVDYAPMREYVLDWFDGIRGTYGQRWRYSIENTLESLSGVFKSMKDPLKRQRLARDVDGAFNAFNSLLVTYHMGGRLKSAALNSLQFFMTGWPEIGTKYWLVGESAIPRVMADFARGRGPQSPPLTLAKRLGLIDFVPDNLGELHKQAAEAIATKNPLKTFEAVVSGVGRVSMKAFQVVEWVNHIKASWAGYNYARNVLNESPIRAADYAKKFSLRVNYILDPINTPPAFLTGVGKPAGLLKRFQINYMEQIIQNSQRALQGDAAPLVRMLVALGMVGGTAGIPLYREASDYLMRTFGINLPKVYPIESITSAFGMGSGISIESAAAPFNIGGGDRLFDPLIPVGISTIQNIAKQGPGALAPRAIQEFGPALTETLQGQARSTTTGKPIANRSLADKTLSAVGFQPSAQVLRNRYLNDIENAYKGGRHDIVSKLRNEAAKKGIIIKSDTINAIRERVKAESRGRSTGLQLWDEIKKSLGSVARSD